MRFVLAWGVFVAFSATAPAQGIAEPFGYSGIHGQRIAAESGNILLRADTVVRPAGNARFFLRVLATTPRTVSGFDLPLALLAGPARVLDTYLYSANSNDRPANVLARGSMGSSTAMQWRRTVLDVDVRTTAGSFYFLAIDLPAEGVRLQATTESNRSHVAYFERPAGGSLGPMQVAGLLYKVNTDGVRPAIRSVTPPTLGTRWHVRCTNVPDGGLEFLLLSVGREPSFAGVPPGNFFYGAYCCHVLTIGRGNTADFVFDLPRDPSLSDFGLTVQWDIATGPQLVNPTLSNALAVVLR